MGAYKVMTSFHVEKAYGGRGSIKIIPEFSHIEIAREPALTPADAVKRAIQEGEKIVVFVACGGHCVMLDDDAKGFPSEQMITQMRLLGR